MRGAIGGCGNENTVLLISGSVVNGVMCQAADTSPCMSEHICELMWHGCMRGDIGGRGNTKTILVIWPVSLIN